jgi:hypothetical protein
MCAMFILLEMRVLARNPMPPSHEKHVDLTYSLFT